MQEIRDVTHSFRKFAARFHNAQTERDDFCGEEERYDFLFIRLKQQKRNISLFIQFWIVNAFILVSISWIAIVIPTSLIGSSKICFILHVKVLQGGINRP
jgi:hypothetical protein